MFKFDFFHHTATRAHSDT